MFKGNVRAEAQYFKSLKSLVASLSAWKNGTLDRTTEDIIDNCIFADKTIIMLYKNLGEAWNELTAYIMHNKAGLEKLKAELESFKDEINEKVDDVNNYLVNRITEIENALHDLEGRVDIVEEDLNTMHRVKIYAMRYENNVRRIYDGSQLAETSEMIEKLSTKYNVFVYYFLSGQTEIYKVSSFTNDTVYFEKTFLTGTNHILGARFAYKNNTVQSFSSYDFNAPQVVSDINNLNISVTNLNGRIGDAEIEINGIGATIEEAKPYQFTITLPSSGWSTYGSMFFYHAQETIDLTKDAMVTLTAGGALPNYDVIFDNMERARAIGLFGCFDDNGGDEAMTPLQFYANSVPTDPIQVLVTVSPYISNSTAVSVVVNGIY